MYRRNDLDGQGVCRAKIYILFLSTNFLNYMSLHKDEIDSSNEAQERGGVVPMERLPLKQHVGNDCEDYQRHAFLYDFKLYERERTAVAVEPDAVCRYLAAILEEGDAPREGDNADKRPV